MPAVSLVVCVHDQRELLDRLLQETTNCYDELLVVHDGPEVVRNGLSIPQIVSAHGGRFLCCPREYQQEPHWPFAWSQARHDWILRLDADEVPTAPMKQWLLEFRKSEEPSTSISGYTCVWPLWDGKRVVSARWPADRMFLFHKDRVRFFGMVEQVPVPDGLWTALDLTLEHRPTRKSYGFANLLIRSQAYTWRKEIAESLLGAPTDLACWRWESSSWPVQWERIRSRPIRTFFYELLYETLRTLRNQWRLDRRFYPSAAVSGPIHHALICLSYLQHRREKKANNQ